MALTEPEEECLAMAIVIDKFKLSRPSGSSVIDSSAVIRPCQSSSAKESAYFTQHSIDPQVAYKLLTLVVQDLVNKSQYYAQDHHLCQLAPPPPSVPSLSSQLVLEPLPC